jgi:hypothetical protein
MNIYGLLGVNPNISEDDMKKMFRRKTLDCDDNKMLETMMRAYEDFEQNNISVGVNIPNISIDAESIKSNMKKYDGMLKMFGGMMGIDIESELKKFDEELTKNFMNYDEFAIPRRKQNVVELLDDCDNIIEEIVEPERMVLIYNISIQQLFEGFYLKEVDNKLDFEDVYIQPGRTEISLNKNKIDYSIKFEIDQNEKFEYKDSNLYYHHEISLKEALCGFSFVMKHLNGTEYTLNNFNKIINPGHEIRLNNLGIKKGQLIIKFNIKFPENLNDEQKEKIKEML